MKVIIKSRKPYKKCAECKQPIKVGDTMVVETIGHMRPRHWHVACDKTIAKVQEGDK